MFHFVRIIGIIWQIKMEQKNIIYLRVSKENEKEQDLEAALDLIINKFELNINDCIIYKERGSAYDLNKIHKRKEYLKILDILYDADTTTIKDLFLMKVQKKDINFYTWDYARIMRNLEFNLFFSMLSYWFDINIYSFKDGKIKINKNENPSEKLLRYFNYAIQGFSAEDYSYHISENIKKSIKKKNGITYGTKKDPKGRKWGRSFVNDKGESIKLSLEKVQEINKRILYLNHYYKRKNMIRYYSYIIEKINQEFNINISKSYLSQIINKRK